MKDINHLPDKVYQLNVDEYGRFVIPADAMIRQACRSGDKLVGIESQNGDFAIRRHRDVVRELQQYFKSKIPKDRNLVDELISDRRAEAARE